MSSKTKTNTATHTCAPFNYEASLACTDLVKDATKLLPRLERKSGDAKVNQCIRRLRDAIEEAKDENRNTVRISLLFNFIL